MKKYFDSPAQQILFLLLAVLFLSLPITLIVGMLMFELTSDVMRQWWMGPVIYFVVALIVGGVVFFLGRKMGLAKLVDGVLENAGSRDVFLGLSYIIVIVVFSIVRKLKRK